MQSYTNLNDSSNPFDLKKRSSGNNLGFTQHAEKSIYSTLSKNTPQFEFFPKQNTTRGFNLQSSFQRAPDYTTESTSKLPLVRTSMPASPRLTASPPQVLSPKQKAASQAKMSPLAFAINAHHHMHITPASHLSLEKQ